MVIKPDIRMQNRVTVIMHISKHVRINREIYAISQKAHRNRSLSMDW